LKNLYNYTSEETGVVPEFRESMQDFVWNYMYYLEDDFNIVEWLVIFHELIKFINTWVSENSFSFDEKDSLLDALKTFNQVLWILDFSILETDSVPDEILKKLEERNKTKADKDFETADRLRNEIEESGYKIIDGRDWSRAEKM
jgi:cysteinyl-tRNA synthetase